MRVTVDKDGCISCGLCVSTCPEVFGFDENGISEVVGNPADNAAEVQAAADSCPVGVIHISEI